ncbi:unnamed protein product [Schistosoma margrebowiei]|uniref:Uncharacterized protein n=1 Tax=Schistosoma margrebowiei TaxID=48269 RepID=A0A183L8K9_9TREM|nr:unnamed protein product [Schistosoma margrebowiei]
MPEGSGPKKRYHKERISIKTLHKVQERGNRKTAIKNSRTRAQKVKEKAGYTEANKQKKKSIRDDRQKYMEEVAMIEEKAPRERNMRQYYDKTKTLAKKYSKQEIPDKNKDGRTITEIQQQRSRWVEYFEELLNRPALLNPSDINVAPTDLPTDVTQPTIE